MLFSPGWFLFFLLAVWSGCWRFDQPSTPPAPCCGACPSGVKRECPVEMTAGTSVAVTAESGRRPSLLLGLDLTVGEFLGLSPWASAGLRYDPTGLPVSLFPYFEAGLSLAVFVAGAGVSLRMTPTPSRIGPHLFLGVPIPLKLGFYLEPYYRPLFEWELDPRNYVGVVHEVGLLLKAWTQRGYYSN